MEKKGIFVLSLDTELAWGSFDKGLKQQKINEFNNTRYCINEMLSLLEKYQISATFAMVGHLMLSACHEQNGTKHPELVRPNFSWYQKDWFSEDPCTDVNTDPIWYGSDILEDICKANPPHEIGSHSFSHLIFGDEGCYKECADSDIKECVRVAEELDLKLTSFIYPRDSIGHRDVLKKYGFLSYRGHGDEWYRPIKTKPIRRICHYLDNLLGIAPNTSKPIIDELGLFMTTGNMHYYQRSGIRKLIPIFMRVRKAKKGVDLAIKRGEVFHMWFHPFNLASDPDGLLKGLDQILAYVRKKMDEGSLDSLTMEELRKSYEDQIGKDIPQMI